jgi:hypothetical protein
MASFFQDLLPTAAAGYGLKEQYDSLENLGKDTGQVLDNTGQYIQDNMTFQPVGVTGSMGTASYTPSGTDYALSSTGQGIQDNMYGMGQDQLGKSAQDPYSRQNQLYQKMNQAQNPERLREQARMNQQLRNSGRSGMTSQMYGGTPEQLAYAKAVQEQQSANWLGAGTQANTELMDQYKRGIGMMDQGYKPMEQMLEYGDQGLKRIDLNDALNTNRTGMLSDLNLGGLSAINDIENLKGQNLSDYITGSQQQLQTAGSWLDNATKPAQDAVTEWWQNLWL